MFIVSPPFGNYIFFDSVLSVKGSFTLEERPGLIPQIFRTFRYSFEHNGWINKIGLRNKGIDYAIEKYKNTNNIVSIAILKETDIPVFLRKIPRNMNLEINVSCPNTDKKMVNTNLKQFINSDRSWCIIKLSPITEHSQIDNYYSEGFRQFHCSNTLPIKEGGVSGPIIKEYNKTLITYIKSKYPDTTVIGGGGIRDWKDVLYYKNLGCNYYSISTVFLNPFLLVNLYINNYNNK
jgi:dihydroorotate dehydrogenase